MHKVNYLLSKKTLKISECYIENDNTELKNLLELDNYIFNSYDEAVKKQSYLDCMVKFN